MACLYRHIRKDTEMPFYIGIGVSTKRAYSKTHRNDHWKAIVGKTDYEVEVLFDDIDYEYAKIKEKEFIALYKRKEDGGLLCNLTLGGDGVLGIVHTEDARKKMGAPNKGKTISEWQKQKTSEFHKGRKRSEETKKKMSENCLGENNHSSKLTELDVLEIRNLYKKEISSRKLAKMFNVQKNCILSIIHKKTWKHI